MADILWELELKLRTKFSVGTPRPAGVSIEHILPQSWAANWPLPDKRKAPLDYISGADQAMLAAIAARKGLLHTLGNLTLVTVPANTVASNSPFAEKKVWLQQSLLAMNLAINENDEWSELEIKDRAVQLAELGPKPNKIVAG